MFSTNRRTATRVQLYTSQEPSSQPYPQLSTSPQPPDNVSHPFPPSCNSVHASRLSQPIPTTHPPRPSRRCQRLLSSNCSKPSLSRPSRHQIICRARPLSSAVSTPPEPLRSPDRPVPLLSLSRTAHWRPRPPAAAGPPRKPAPKLAEGPADGEFQGFFRRVYFQRPSNFRWVLGVIHLLMGKR